MHNTDNHKEEDNSHSDKSIEKQEHSLEHISFGENHAQVKSENSISLILSKYTEALIKGWNVPLHGSMSSPNKISVSQTVSFAAFLYEKMRNAVEFREENLIRRAAVERILKRRMILNENGRGIAEVLIKEMLWARYYENNTIGEEKIIEIQTIIDKYFFLRNELNSGRKGKEHEKINKFILEVLSCEIQENLSPDHKRQAFTNYVYQIIRHFIAPFGKELELERDLQVYIAVERTFAHSDNPLIRYNLLKIMIPEITKITWKTADKILPDLYHVYDDIEIALAHPYGDKIRNIVRKEIPAFLILRDIFENNSHNIANIISDEVKLKFKVDETCRRRYDESKSRLRTTAVRSFIYILLTKVFLALLIEIPYDIYILKEISYLPIAVNIIFPPSFMALIVLTVTIPGDDNTRRIYQLIKGIVTTDPDVTEISKTAFVMGKRKARSIIFQTTFSLIYLLTYVFSFGSIIYVLSLLKFSMVSQGVFIFFMTLVSFFAFRVIQITQEFQVVNREGFLSPIADFFFLPIIRVGQWLSGEILVKFNFLIFVFDFIIEMPFKAIVEVFDEWVHFVKLKKEEII